MDFALDDDVCGVSRCSLPAFGSVPADSPLPGDRSFVEGSLRLPTCVDHGREHHRRVLGRNPQPGDLTIERIEDPED